MNFHHLETYNIPRNYTPRASSDMPIALKSYGLVRGHNHVLRCPYLTDVSGCTHRDDIILACRAVASAYDLPRPPDETELRLHFSKLASSGTLEIAIDREWGNVCSSGFDQQAADTACRQLGYTNAKNFSSTKVQSVEGQVWLSSINCSHSSCPCLHSCFKLPSFPTTNCSSGDYITIECTFNVAVADKLFSGSPRSCPIADLENFQECINDTSTPRPITTKDTLTFVLVPIAVLLAIGLIVVLIGFSILATACYCKRKKARLVREQEHGYTLFPKGGEL